MRMMLNTYNAVPGHGDIVKEMDIDGPIRLYQHPTLKRGSYAVQYGKQFDYKLSYQDAAEHIGHSIMHALACQGLVDNERFE